MTIKKLLEILQQSPDKKRNVYIQSGTSDSTTIIGHNFDDNNDLDLYQVSEGAQD